jgi:hypothetical protein
MASVFDKLKYFFNTESIIKRTSKGGKIVYKKIHTKGTSLNKADNMRGGFFTTNGKLQKFTLAGNQSRNKIEILSRFERYEEYEAMDEDSLVAGVLDIYSEDSTTLNSAGEIINIVSENEKIVNILTNLFYDILKIEFNLSDWTRQTLKYGDFFLKLDVDEEYGVTGFQPILPQFIDIQVEVDEELQKPKIVYYLTDRISQGSLSAFSTTEDENKLDNYELIHFKYKQDENFFPFSKSLLESGRRAWSEIKLMEDSMLVYHITRSPSKRAFFINVGNLEPDSVDSFMENIITKIKRDTIVNENGKINLRYNIENILDDYFIPVRGSGDSSRIETIDGGGDWNIEPLEYLKDKLLASFKVPKSYLGYEEDLNGKSTLAGEDIRFARSVRNVQKMMIDQLTKIAIIHLYVQGFKMSELLDFNLELVNPSTIHEKQQLEIIQEKIGIASDALNTNLFSRDWVYKNILALSDNEVDDIKSELSHDKLLKWKLQSIENEGKIPKPGENNSEENDNEENDSQHDSNNSFSDNSLGTNENDPYDENTFEGNKPELSFESSLKKQLKKKSHGTRVLKSYKNFHDNLHDDISNAIIGLNKKQYRLKD